MRTIFVILMALVCQASAELVFDQPFQEIKAPSNADRVSADFPFTNKGATTIRVAKVNPNCSCIAIKISDGKLEYAPGETGVIRTEFDMGNFSGEVDKEVAVWLEGDPEDRPSVKLVVRVHIPALVVLEPKTIKWETGATATTLPIRVTMHHSDPIHITRATCSSDAFQLELKTLEEGSSYEVRVTPKTLEKPVLGIIRIETDCKINKHKIQQGFAIIQNPPRQP